MTLPVPTTLQEALSPQWLTDALRTRFPEVEVTEVVAGALDDRVATNALFEIRGKLPPGLPARLCVKGYFNALGQMARFVGQAEALFYRELAEPSGVRTLHSVYADFDPVTANSVVITEDVAVQGAVFLDGNSEYGVDRVADSLEQLATLHAATWENPQLADATWLTPSMTMIVGSRDVAVIAETIDGPMGDRMPAEVRDAQLVWDTAMRGAVASEQGTDGTPWCVMHGDAHVGNVYLDGEGRPSFLDWQLVQRGRWNIDVGYHLSSALSVEERRASEQDLLRHYLERLASFGVEAPGFDNALRAIRAGIVHGLYLWSITSRVNPAVTSTLLERLGTAAADHDALGSGAGGM